MDLSIQADRGPEGATVDSPNNHRVIPVLGKDLDRISAQTIRRFSCACQRSFGPVSHGFQNSFPRRIAASDGREGMSPRNLARCSRLARRSRRIARQGAHLLRPGADCKRLQREHIVICDTLLMLRTLRPNWY